MACLLCMHIFIIVLLIFKINYLASKTLSLANIVLSTRDTPTDLFLLVQRRVVMHLAFTCMIQDIDTCWIHQIRSNCRRQHFENFVYRVLPHEIIRVRNLPKDNRIPLATFVVQVDRRMSENRLNDSNCHQGHTRLPSTAVTIQEKTMLITSMSNKHHRLLSLRKKRKPKKFLSEI